MGRRIQVALDCEAPDRLAAFWAEALEYRLADAPPGHASWSDFSRAVASTPGEGTTFYIQLPAKL